MSDAADDERDQMFLRGMNAAYRGMLGACLRGLSYDEMPEAVQLITERADAIAQLRTACEHFGDNDWDDRLHLADVIEKHLLAHLMSQEVD